MIKYQKRAELLLRNDDVLIQQLTVETRKISNLEIVSQICFSESMKTEIYDEYAFHCRSPNPSEVFCVMTVFVIETKSLLIENYDEYKYFNSSIHSHH